jgi:RimJ/RimL family protein N-acetyltransferase
MRDAAEQLLETPRLLLEPLVPEHAPAVFDDLRDPRLYSFIPTEPPESLAALDRRYRALRTRASPDGKEAWLNWIARLRVSGQYIGTFQATVYGDRRAHLAYIVFSRYWRQGYAKEGCARVLESLRHEWRITVVAAELDTRNVASIRLAEALGFKRVGFKPGADFFKGSASDEYLYEFLAHP